MSETERDFEVLRLDPEGDGVGPMWVSDLRDQERANDATAIFAETTNNVTAVRVTLSGDAAVSVIAYTTDGDISAEDRAAMVSRFGVDEIDVDADIDIVKLARKIVEASE